MVGLYRAPILRGGGGYVACSTDFYLPSLRLYSIILENEGGGGQYPVGVNDELHSLDKMGAYDCDHVDSEKVVND